MNFLGNFPNAFTTVPIMFTTTDANGASVAPSAAFVAGDVNIYKDGNAAQKTTTNGLTMTSPFDSIVGLHLLLIDTSNNTGDTGFWAAGHVYNVILTPATTTVAGQTIVKEIGSFTLDAAVAVASVTGAVGSVTGAVGSVTARVTANTDQLASQTVTAAAGVTFPSSVASPTNITAASGVALTSSYDFAKGTTAMTESYAANTAAMTPVQSLHMIWALLENRSLASTTLTAKKLDNSTTAMTFTLDSATVPTTQVRAT